MSSKRVDEAVVERHVPVFEPDDFDGNVAQLLEYFGYRVVGDVPVSKFTIHSSPGYVVEEEVRESKYKSALFLYYLSTLVSPEGCCKCLKITLDFRFLTQCYFGDEICQDALENLETKHTTVKALLGGMPVVFLDFEPHH